MDGHLLNIGLFSQLKLERDRSFMNIKKKIPFSFQTPSALFHLFMKSNLHSQPGHKTRNLPVIKSHNKEMTKTWSDLKDVSQLNV